MSMLVSQPRICAVTEPAVGTTVGVIASDGVTATSVAGEPTTGVSVLAATVTVAGAGDKMSGVDVSTKGVDDGKGEAGI